MRQLMFLLKKEFLQIFRNKAILRMVVVMPVFQLALFPWAATFEQKDISLSIIDNDHTTTSEHLVNKILSSGYFKLDNYGNSYKAALRRVELSKSDLIFEIPHNFEKSISTAQTGNMMMSIDAVNGQKAALGMSYITQIITSFMRDNFSGAGGTSHPQVEIKPYFRYNEKMDYKTFMVPGVIVIMMTMIAAMLSSLNIVREKELGTMEQINVTPLPKSTFILGKLAPFWVIGLVVLTIGLLIAKFVYGLTPLGSIGAIYIFSIVYLLAFTGFGLAISNFAQTQQQAMFLIMFFVIIFMLLCGLFTPITSMPKWMQVINVINPMQYFIDVMRLVYLKGSGFGDILPQFFKTVGFMLGFNILAVISYRKTTN